MQQSVSSESELLSRVVKNQRWSGFSEVSQISTRKISPDIDFLRIDNVHKETYGYEFKLLRFRKDWGRLSLMPMYTAIGEAIQYFRFGVDRSYVVLGIPSTIPTNAFKKTLNDVHTCISPLHTLQIGGKICLGVCLWTEQLDNFQTVLSPTGNIFMNDDVKHLKACLLRLELKYRKEFKFGEEC